MLTPPPATVSVIVPTRDRPSLLREALASIRAIEGPGLALEILVGDNGSLAQTSAIAAEFGARHIAVDTPGAGAARNAGLRAATGDYIAFLDDDDVWTSDALRPQLALLREQPELGGVIGQVRLVDAELRPMSGLWPDEGPEDDRFRAILAHYPQLGTTVVRASVRDTVGLFDESLLGDQDWDWHLRLALAHPIGYTPATGSLFRQRPAGIDGDLRWRRLAFFRRVFRQNVRRAGARRPSRLWLARTYLRHTGEYQWHFARDARAHIEAGDRRAARRALLRAARASVPHSAAAMVRGGDFRWALLRAIPLGPLRRPAVPASGTPPA